MAHSILIIDDEPRIADILEKFLLKQGFGVTKLLDARQAIALIKSGIKYDLLITDVKMPGATGFDILKAKKELNDRVPVIVLTGSIDADIYLKKGELRDLGCSEEDICYKPVDLFALMTKVKCKLNIPETAGGQQGGR